MRNSGRQPNPQARNFRPPCCPNPNCRFHLPADGWRFVKDGAYCRPGDQARIQRFRCLHCRRNFSTQTFAATYWLRCRSLLVRIAELSVTCAGLRQTARTLRVSHPTVGRHLARAGRHCILYHRNLIRGFAPPEPLVVDGFETFEYSQYFPFHLNLAVGSQSWFHYHFTDSPLRRKGRMSDFQRKRRAELEATFGRPDPKAVEKGMAELLRPLVATLPKDADLLLHSDDHQAYPRALKRLPPDGPVIEHHITSSKARRTRRNPLFPVNLADLLLRHSHANHKRETISFSKRRQAAIERLATFTVWRNCIKWRQENGPRETAAMVLGLQDRLKTWRQVLQTRLFPGHSDLPRVWKDYYWRRVKTAVFGTQQNVHCCRYAF